MKAFTQVGGRFIRLSAVVAFENFGNSTLVYVTGVHDALVISVPIDRFREIMEESEDRVVEGT